jgi:hypothetical protein
MESWTVKFRGSRRRAVAIGEMCPYLRIHGSGSHWIEGCRGDIFIKVTDERDESISLENSRISSRGAV